MYQDILFQQQGRRVRYRHSIWRDLTGFNDDLSKEEKSGINHFGFHPKKLMGGEADYTTNKWWETFTIIRDNTIE